MKLPLLKNIVSQTKVRFRNLSIKRTVPAIALVIVGMLLSNLASGTTVVNGITMQAPTSQSTTYGSTGVPVYTINLNRNGNNNGSDNMTFAWTGATPVAVTPSFDQTIPYNPRNIGSINLTLTTTAATTLPGSYPFKITNVDANGGGTKTTTGTLVVNPKPLTLGGLIIPARNYDGTTIVIFTGTASLSGGIVGSDVVNLVTSSPTASYATSAAGTNKTVTFTGYSLGGANANKYTLSLTLTGTINPAPLTVTANAVSKVYGNTLNTVTGSTEFTSTPLQNGETIGTVTIAYGTGSTAGAAIGTYANSVTPSAATGGTFTASNYTITYVKNTLTVTSSTYDWTGANSTAWNVPQNWNVNGVQQTVYYPGTGNDDNARIGFTGTIIAQPTISTALDNDLNSLTFGNASGSTTLTVNRSFNTGDFTNNGTAAFIAGTATLNVNNSYSNPTGSILTVSGSASFSVNFNSTVTNAGTLVNSGSGTVTLTSTGGSGFLGTSGTITNNGPITNSGTGKVTLNASNTVIGTGTITNNSTINQSSASGAMLLEISALGGTITNAGTINQTNAGSLTFAPSFAFINISIVNSGTITQSNTGTMTFSGSYNNSTSGSKLTQTGTGKIAFGDTYDNSGTTIFGAGTITMADDYSNNAGSTTFGSGPATLSGDLDNSGGTTAFGTGSTSVAGDFTNSSGSVTSSTGTESFASMNFTNNATLTFGTGLVTFNNTQNVTKFNTTTGITFVNVTFSGGKNVLLQSGNHFLASIGVLTLTNNSFINLNPPTSTLTLLSDANGSATIAAITGSSSITGNVNVQRFIKGSSDIGDLSKRGYRLLSSSVHTATVGGVNVSDLLYLTNSVFVSGPGYLTNGFNVTTTQNPSIYLFREDVPPPPSNTTQFTTGYNWKGVAQINNTTPYLIGTQYKNDPLNVLDTSTTVPVGNAVLFFFRGDKNVQPVLPISPPNDVTLTHQGTLNTGSITVRLWYSNAANALGNNFSFTAANTPGNSGSTGALTAGFTLVGNPYPSTINWEKYNNTNAPNAIVGGNGLGSIIYEFDVASKQYGAYIPDPSTTDFTLERPSGNFTNGATNLIASGVGFFVQASGSGQNLTFNETAKTNAQSDPAVLLNLMGKAKELVAAPKPVLHLKLVKDSVNYDEIVIAMNNKASSKFILGEDARDMDGSGSLESLSSYSSDSARLAINAVPFPGIQPEVIRIMATANSSGPYTLTVPMLKNLPDLYQMWLKDAFTADSVQLKANTSYPFTIDNSNAATFGSSRFTVVIRQDTAFAYKLLDFTASKTNHQSDVQLVWKTTNEGNYTNFTVERSTDDGKTFTVVGGMAGTGAGTYSLVDKNPDKGRNLYRLKQEDINDSITYSKVVDVKFGDVFSKLHIFPNPATHTINLAIAEEGYYKGNYSISFVNSSGRVVKEVKSSQADWQGNITYLMPGTYLVRVINNKTQSLVGENKFVKL